MPDQVRHDGQGAPHERAPPTNFIFGTSTARVAAPAAQSAKSYFPQKTAPPPLRRQAQKKAPKDPAATSDDDPFYPIIVTMPRKKIGTPNVRLRSDEGAPAYCPRAPEQLRTPHRTIAFLAALVLDCHEQPVSNGANGVHDSGISFGVRHYVAQRLGLRIVGG
jgi:hypothetical protein